VGGIIEKVQSLETGNSCENSGNIGDTGFFVESG
jgi:hypothetical protein